MELTIIVAIIAFLAVTLLLVGLLLFAKAKLTSSGEVTIDINDGEKVITAESGSTLLSTLANNKVFLPSACGGVFPICEVYQYMIPTYPSGYWFFGFASKKLHPVNDFDEEFYNSLNLKDRYYNKDVHKASFALPNYVKELLK